MPHLRSVNLPVPDAERPRFAAVRGRMAVDLGGIVTDAVASAAAPDALALYAYPTAHWPVWQTIRAQARVAGPDAAITPGMLDEHLSLDGLVEADLWLGDVLRLPDCELVVAAPRMPDPRFDASLGFPHAAAMVRQSRWCGAWLGVRTPGTLAAGDPLTLVPGPREVGLVEMFRARLQGRLP